MFKQIRTIASAALTLSAFTAAGAAAQGPTPPTQPIRPTVSPYLNLVRPGTPPAINYYNLVRPQTEFYSSLQRLQQQTSLNGQGLTSLEQSMTQRPVTLPPTGFVPSFMSYRQYFMTYNGTGLGLASSGMTAPTRPTTSTPPPRTR